MHWKLRHNRLLSRGASNLGIFALECAVDIRVGLRRGLFMKGGDRYEPRKTFLLADLQEIVIGPSVFLVFQPSNEIDIWTRNHGSF